MKDATLQAGEILVKALVKESKDRLRLVSQVLSRRPTIQNIQEAVLLIDGAKLILVSAA